MQYKNLLYRLLVTIHRSNRAIFLWRLRTYNFLFSISNLHIFYENFTPSSTAKSPCTTLGRYFYTPFFLLFYPLFDYDSAINWISIFPKIFSQMFIRSIDHHQLIGIEFHLSEGTKKDSLLLSFHLSSLPLYFPRLTGIERFQRVDFNPWSKALLLLAVEINFTRPTLFSSIDRYSWSRFIRHVPSIDGHWITFPQIINQSHTRFLVLNLNDADNSILRTEFSEIFRTKRD